MKNLKGQYIVVTIESKLIKDEMTMSIKDEYLEKLKTKLDEINGVFYELEDKMQKANVDSRSKYKEQIKEFRQKRNELQQRLRDIHDAGEDAWEELKQGTENAWSSLKGSLMKAKSEFERGYKEGSKG
jgi:chromosome segregation ATPase